MENRDAQGRPHAEVLSRRGFLGLAASAAGASLCRRAGGAEAQPKLRMPLDTPPSRVVTVRSAHVLDGTVVHRAILGEMLDATLTGAYGVRTASDAWQLLLEPEDIIGLKFNRAGQQQLGTTEAMVEVLVQSIVSAGFSPRQIVCIEAPPGTETRHGTTPPRQGYSTSRANFGSGRDQLALALGQVTALINVPFLKTHELATMTCALKNLSHGLIKHPARYHRNGCSPYIADIVALEEIRTKLRLCLVDALRVSYNGSPDANGPISAEGFLLASSDPVAVDAVGLGMLNDVRRRHGLGSIARSAEQIGYLAAAHRRGLGIAVIHGIDVKHIAL